MKSLIQTLFDENEEESNEAPVPAKAKSSLAAFLNSSRDDSMEVEEEKEQACVYVEDTDSEND